MHWTDLKNNPRLRNYFLKRIKIIRLTREFFWKQGFLETETPSAVKLPGQEPYLSPIPVIFHEPTGIAHQFYLHTSPEFAMKKLLAADFKKIFQITKTFRDFENFGGQHNPEFTMIEWYRSPGKYSDIMKDTEKLFKFIGKKIKKDKLNFNQKEVSLFCRWEKKTMKEVWREYLNINLDKHLSHLNMLNLAKKFGFNVNKKYSYDDLFYLIFLNKIEPHLGQQRPIIIYEYPQQMCSLSRPTSDRRYAERFELYIGGLELANAYGELTDPIKQKQQLLKDQKIRQKLKKTVYNIDNDFINALSSGILPAGGIALGMDRMIMLFAGARNINDVIFQSAADMIEQ